MKTIEDVLKEAILMEKRGQAIYNEVAQKTPDPDVKKIFSLMAEEEAMHARFLGEQLRHYVHHNEFISQDLQKTSDQLSNLILNSDLINKIEAAGFEAAAINAAIELETRSIEVYEQQAQEATDEHIKKLFQWLAQWENTHYNVLLKLDQELKEKIWYNNEFWPF